MGFLSLVLKTNSQTDGHTRQSRVEENVHTLSASIPDRPYHLGTLSRRKARSETIKIFLFLNYKTFIFSYPVSVGINETNGNRFKNVNANIRNNGEIDSKTSKNKRVERLDDGEKSMKKTYKIHHGSLNCQENYTFFFSFCSALNFFCAFFFNNLAVIS
jgi:hypothetical protein